MDQCGGMGEQTQTLNFTNIGQTWDGIAGRGQGFNVKICNWRQSIHRENPEVRAIPRLEAAEFAFPLCGRGS